MHLGNILGRLEGAIYHGFRVFRIFAVLAITYRLGGNVCIQYRGYNEAIIEHGSTRCVQCCRFSGTHLCNVEMIGFLRNLTWNERSGQLRCNLPFIHMHAVGLEMACISVASLCLSCRPISMYLGLRWSSISVKDN